MQEVKRFQSNSGNLFETPIEALEDDLAELVNAAGDFTNLHKAMCDSTELWLRALSELHNARNQLPRAIAAAPPGPFIAQSRFD